MISSSIKMTGIECCLIRISVFAERRLPMHPQGFASPPSITELTRRFAGVRLFWLQLHDIKPSVPGENDNTPCSLYIISYPVHFINANLW
jgi:hypothetical protein